MPKGLALFEVEDTLTALGALARFHRQGFHIPVGAITGSSGKTTAKEMTHAILSLRGPALKTQGNLNNEVGVPLTLFELQPEHVAAVVEMGMSARGEIERLTAIVGPDAGLITGIHPAHLLALGTLEDVAEAKGELFRGLKPGATAVVNVDDPLVLLQASKSGLSTLAFGQSEAAAVRLMKVEPLGRDGLRIAIRYCGQEHAARIGFVGHHNAQNATGAFALAIALGYSPQECVEGLEAAKPHVHRLSLLPAPGGFAVLDDSYNANPASMAAALSTLQSVAQGGRAIAVLGDMLELGLAEVTEHRSLGEKAAVAVQLVAFFGPRSVEAHRAAASLNGAAAHFTEVEPLVAWLKPQLRPGDVVLVKASRGMQLERVVNALLGLPRSEGVH
jgi:UDP-N-acetylmuramoyl-tripeptide--D-alanyl-D-alanine ligase